MSKNRKNNHYHYSEKFEDRNRRNSNGKRAFVPFKSLVISLIVLLMFGLVSVTFGAYVTENEPEYDPEAPGILSEVRNLKSSREVAYTGADYDLASTGATWSFSGGYMYFEKPSTWTTNASSIQLVIGKGTSSGYSSCYTMSAISNTNYYVVSLPGSGWGDATYMCVIGNSGAWNSGDWGSNNISNASNKTSIYTSGITSSSNQRYLFDGSLTYKGTDNNSMDIVTLAAHACYTTNGTSYTSDNSTGGTVNITSYYFSEYNAVSSSSTGASDSASYSAAKATANSTFAASAATGYRFQGWYTAATGGSLVSSNASYTYKTTSGNKTVYARFIKTYTVSITKSPSAYSGTAPTLTGGGSTAASITVDVGTSVTLNSNVSNTGITCTFRKSSPTGTTVTSPQTITAATTFYACYTLAAPTDTSLSYATTTEGASAISPSKTASSNANPAGTLSYSYAYISGGTGPSNGYSLDTSTGAFSATVAGTYKIRMTVTDTCSGLTATATKDATVTVKPARVTGFSYSVTGQNSGAGTQAEPWKVPVNSTSFAITSYIPDDGSRDPNYTYTWTRTDGTYLISNGTITSGSHTATSADTYVVTDTATSGTATEDVIHNVVLAETLGNIYKVAVTKTRNGVTSDPYYVIFYYGVTADFLVIDEFDFAQFNSNDPVQKIYAEDNGINYIKSDYEAGGTSFHTMLYFSNNNIGIDSGQGNKVAVWTPSQFTITSGNPFAGTHSALPNDSSHTTSDLITMISTVARNNANLMSTAGPKWFKGYVDDYQNARVDPCYPELHTTVGTSSTVANRPVYFVDTTGVTHVNSRVMAFYLTESDSLVHYQTGQIVSGRSDTYRFYVPADATTVSFAYVADNNYVLPTVNNGTFSYAVYTDHTVLMAWTPTIDLTAEANQGKTTFVADTPGTKDDNGIYNYTNTANGGNMTTLS